VRYGVISDVHGNLPALRSVVTHLRREGVERWLSLGDLIGYGAHPNECVELVASLEPVGVAGNHELIVLGDIPGESSSARALRSHQWTRAALREDVRSYLTALPTRLETDGLVLAHGSLDDPEEYVATDVAAGTQLVQLAAEHPAARVLLLGHTHRQRADSDLSGPLVVRPGRSIRLAAGHRHLLNPGSVGQSRRWELPRAGALLLDLGAGLADFRQVPYDLVQCAADLHKAGLPYRSMHSPPRLRAVVRRRLRRFVR
jgi:predicted phosphodiesterase